MLFMYFRPLASIVTLLVGIFCLSTRSACAQNPAWSGATTGSSTQGTGTSVTQAVATDASGNLFVTGTFTGQVYFGSTLLSSVGNGDLFVAKYVPTTGTWAWALSGGGNNADAGYGIAVSGASVYVTGYITNTIANSTGVLFGGTGTTASTVQVNGASTTAGSDLFVAKYTDNGPSATLGWTQVGGGNGFDQGKDIAVSGTNLYVTGYITNTTTNSSGVLFGGTGITAGTVPVNGASTTASSDLVVVKYTENGSAATLGWTQVGGGTNSDVGTGVAVTSLGSGTSVYVTGLFTNTISNSQGVLFGGAGTVAGNVQVNGASNTFGSDIFVAKYLDNGPSATLSWTQVGGGTSTDYGNDIAVNGANVYVTGFFVNNTSNNKDVLFGGTGTTNGTIQVNGASPTTSYDVFVAKYTDNGSSATLGWTQVGGGSGDDYANHLAVSGPNVYVTGSISNTTSNSNSVLFGGTGTLAGTVPVNGATASVSSDIFVAKYTDNGPLATLSWTQTGGGTLTDYGYGIATNGQHVYVAGYVTPTASFGSYTITNATTGATSVLAQLVDTTPLPVQLIAFTASASGPTSATIAWATATERYSAYFAIERSADGSTWQEIGRVVAAGTTPLNQQYDYVDVGPLDLTKQVYYRLRQVDLDGATTYSPVRTVLFTPRQITLFPNPATASTTLLGMVPGTQVQVLDDLGRLLFSATANVEGTAILDFPPGLRSGLYMVRTSTTATRLIVH
ncbi:MAG: T9SS type A sorting domain-containing protein [Hymenobacter sp.]|nr:MAG: T9SS type A sorting domain-containing protein [Hymenobacter sp.]